MFNHERHLPTPGQHGHSPQRHTAAGTAALTTLALPLMLTSARPPTRAWEVARTVVAPPSSVVKCLWEVFVWGVVLVVCVRVSVSGMLFSVGVCVCVRDLLIFLQIRGTVEVRALNTKPAGRAQVDLVEKARVNP